MNKARNLLETLYEELGLADHSVRREILIKDMEEVNARGHGCQACPGHCCTYESNSMQVDPLEALELLVYLLEHADEKTFTHLEETIHDFRLDKVLSTGRGTYLRRYYTCPFYKKSNLGCSISRKYKPYGCLAFNALKENVSTSGFCRSSQNILKKREALFEEKERLANEYLINFLGLYWSKLPMPVAIRELQSKISQKCS